MCAVPLDEVRLAFISFIAPSGYIVVIPPDEITSGPFANLSETGQLTFKIMGSLNAHVNGLTFYNVKMAFTIL